MRFLPFSSCRLACCFAALLFVFSFSMTFGGQTAFAQCDVIQNTPYTANVAQQPQERIKITVITNTSPRVGSAMYLTYYNAAGVVIGGDSAAPYGCNQVSTFGPYCGTVQPSLNIARIVITNQHWPLQVLDVSVERIRDRDPSNLGGPRPSSAANVSNRGTVYGSVGPPLEGSAEDGSYSRVRLEKGQKLIVNGWAESESVRYGATFYVGIARNVADGYSGMVGVAPYGKTEFRGGFVNNGEAGTFTLKAYSTYRKICKYKMRLSVSNGSSAPPYLCNSCGGGPCPLDTPASPATGPASSFPVQISRGHERSDFAPDLAVTNPRGPSVQWGRQWREVLSLAGTSSPGFSPGWTHPYDVTLNSSGNYDLQVYQPNGAVEAWGARTGADGNVANELDVPAGAPYFVRGLPGLDGPNTLESTHYWQWVEMVWNDGSVWRFEPKDEYLYRLVKVTNSTGQSLSFEYDGPGSGSSLDQALQQLLVEYPAWLQMVVQIFFGEDFTRQYRLKTIKNDVGTALLSLDYRGSDGRLTGATDTYGRRVGYEWETPEGSNIPCLSRVTQMTQSGVDTTSPTLDRYGYSLLAGRPLLSEISRINANGSGPSTAINDYDGLGRVIKTTDANGNSRTYTYGEGQTTVTVRDANGASVQSYVKFYDSMGRDAGWADASGHRWAQFYEDESNPGRATRQRDPMGRETRTSYDAFGNVTRITTPRGVTITFTWSYAAWRLGRLMAVQKSAGTTALPPTTFTYKEPSGLLESVNGPHPNGDSTITTSYSYDNYGNVLTISQPGDLYNPTRTTHFSYTEDNGYTQSMVVGRPIAIRDHTGGVTHLRYNTHYGLYSVTDASGKTTTTITDYYDNPIRTILPATGQTGGGGGEIRYAYAYRGGPLVRTQIYDETGTPTRTFHRVYGAEGELKNLYGNTLAQAFDYDALYRLRAFSDGNLSRTTYLYDGDGRLRETTYPNGTAGGTASYDRERITAYDDGGSALQTVDGRGVVTNLAYNDPDGQLTSIQHPATTYENVALSYDGFGRLQERSDFVGRETYSYTAAEALASQSTTYQKADYSWMPTWTQSYLYNANGSLARIATPIGHLNSYYDGAGRLAAMSGIDGATTRWSYLPNDWLSTQLLPGNIQIAYAYNDLGQTLVQGNNRLNAAGSVSEILSQFGHPSDVGSRLQYNASGQMTRSNALATPTYPFGGATAFNYDSRGQLSLENSNRGAGYNHTFDYDGAGNPTTWKGASRTFNADNQETTGGNFGYNGDGSPWQYLNRNLKNAQNPNGTRQILSYTSLGQLRQVNAQNADGSAGAALAFYGTRGDGKRAWTQNPTSGNRTYFYYAGDTLIGTAGDAAGSASSVMLWGADGLIGVQSRDAQNVVRSSFFLYDAQGNLAQSVDGTGVVSAAASYTAWGEVVPRADGTVPGVGTFGYGAKFGYLRDGETGFYLCTYRHYDPSAGRWITRDPIGYAGGANLYGYVANDPVNYADPLGLARVVIRFKEVLEGSPLWTQALRSTGIGGLRLPLRFYHAYIVINNNQGTNPLIVRGWNGSKISPQNQSSVMCPTGEPQLIVQGGNFNSSWWEWPTEWKNNIYKGKEIVVVNNDNKSEWYYYNRFMRAGAVLNGQNTPYKLFPGPNSNSSVVAVVNSVPGLKTPFSPPAGIDAPGWHHGP